MSKEEIIAPINEDLDVGKYEEENIKDLIYTIRGRQVMLDSDVARIYHCETKYVNRVVKRNVKRFPEEFCFQLTAEEYDSLRCQFVTLKKNGRGQHSKYMPYAFTEYGVTMISSLLNSEIAIKNSIKIIKAFIEMRKLLTTNGQVFDRLTSLEYKQIENEKNFDKLFSLLQQEDSIKQRIFFEGQIWDSYSLIIDLIKKANKKILIIDNNIDDSILNMLSKKKENVEVVIIISENNTISKLDIQKFNKEYSVLKLAKSNKFHDRFIIIDNIELYHCGASIKDLGKKCFAINKIEDRGVLLELTNKL